jgi:hypothetical protein
MLHEDYNRKFSVEKIMLVLSYKGLVANTARRCETSVENKTAVIHMQMERTHFENWRTPH